MRSRSATSLMVSSRSWLVTGLSLLPGWRSDGSVDLAVVLAGASGGRCGQLSAGRGCVVAGSGVGPGGQDQDDGVIEWPAPGVAFAAWVALGAAVAGAGGAKLAEGDRVAAGFGQEVAAVAEHVRPLPEPCVAGCLPRAQVPGGGDHGPVVARAAQAGDLGCVPDPGVGHAGSVQ